MAITVEPIVLTDSVEEIDRVGIVDAEMEAEHAVTVVVVGRGEDKGVNE